MHEKDTIICACDDGSQEEHTSSLWFIWATVYESRHNSRIFKII